MITKVAKDLFFDLNSEFTVTNTYWESPDEGLTLETEEDVEDTVFEDNERDQWVLEWKVEGVCHQRLQEIIESVYGKPSGQFFRKDLSVNVNNWDVGTVHIVQLNDEITFTERFERTPSK